MSAVLTAALLAACTQASSAPSPSEQETSPGGLEDGVIGVRDWFDDGATFRAGEVRLANADSDFLDCMDDAGFDGRAVGEFRGVTPGAHDALRDADIPDLEFAQEWGFGVTTMWDPRSLSGGPSRATSSEIPVDPTDAQTPVVETETPVEPEPVGTRDPDWVEAAGDCDLATGEKTLEPGPRAPTQKVERARAAFAVAPETQEHHQEWAECMEDAGYSYASPVEAWLDLEDQNFTALETGRMDHIVSQLRPLELEVATATAECGGPVRDLLEPELVDTWVEIARDHGL